MSCLFLIAEYVNPLSVWLILHSLYVVDVSLSSINSMARGHQKIQSQQKNAKKQAEIKKSKGHDQKTAAKAALVFTCGVCRVSGNYSRLFLPQQIILRCSFQPSFNTHLWQITFFMLFELNCIHFGHFLNTAQRTEPMFSLHAAI